jgi:osmotically-inducible protein OsmY
VTLEGRVPTLAMRRTAGRVTRDVPGVVGVDNELAVDPGNVTDTVIQARLQRALDNTVRVSDRELRVDVDDGIVRLTGTLSSAAQSADATAVAHTIQGVKAVHNEINVADPGKLRQHATHAE